MIKYQIKLRQRHWFSEQYIIKRIADQRGKPDSESKRHFILLIQSHQMSWTRIAHYISIETELENGDKTDFIDSSVPIA